MTATQEWDESAPAAYDAIVIGGGLGGLLAAVAMLKAGRGVLVLERLPHLGGRFSTVEHAGCQISTGALHLAPHGGNGPLGLLLRELGVPMRPVGSDVIASFHHAGRHVVCRHFRDILKVPSLSGATDLVRIFWFLKRHPDVPAARSFREWLNGKTKDATVRLMFERCADFSLSLPLDQISYGEMRAVIRNVWCLGPPAAPEGGCQGLTSRLAAAIRDRGGVIATRTEAAEIVIDETGRATGVRAVSRNGPASRLLAAALVVSDIGPTATGNLIRTDRIRGQLMARSDDRTADGLKLQVLGDVPLIAHRGIMFCLDTERISGIVQVSNAVPGVAPAGKHLLNTFQALRSDDIASEKRIALSDLTRIFGPKATKTFDVVHAGVFRGHWPVNRVIQGQDERNQHPCPGLVMVGDAYKPSGLMMVEGVAASVGNVLASITAPRARLRSTNATSSSVLKTQSA